ncbi:MAG: M28 family peptidase [Chloroflexota bacterium]|nr:M28 family peptidase [Chloroflexota bacterium]
MSIRGAVSASELYRHLREVAADVRLSGSPEEARVFDYIRDQLEPLGFQVDRFESEALIGYPIHASLHLLGPEPSVISANGYSLSPGSGPDGVMGALVHVGTGMPVDYAGLDVRGKIVLSDGLAMPGKARAASLAGAIGQVHINDEHIHEMCVSPVWGTPTPETAALLPNVPAVGISHKDGSRLKERLPEEPITVRLVTEPYLAWTVIPTLTADLPGTKEDRFILFSGHVDSWHLGVMDNGTANATLLEVARLLAERRGELRRGVRMAFWSGHSHGRYAGSAWYADSHWHDLHERCVCHVNVDSVGAKGASVLEEAPVMAETFGFGREVIAEVTGAKLEYKRISRSSDQSFWGHGVPTLFATLSEQARDDSATGAAMAQLLGAGAKGGGLGWWWHTTEDTHDKIDVGTLVRDARVYAETLWRLCTLPRLPFDYAATADELAQTPQRYHAAANGQIDLERTRALALELGRELRAGVVDTLDPDRANDVMIALAHLLIPVNYTRSGPFEHDLALGTQPLPGLAEAVTLGRLDPDSDDIRFLRTRLERERNRVEHALLASLRLIRSLQTPSS